MHTGETDGPSKYMTEDSGSITPIRGHSVLSRTFKVESRAANHKQGISSNPDSVSAEIISILIGDQ